MRRNTTKGSGAMLAAVCAVSLLVYGQSEEDTILPPQAENRPLHAEVLAGLQTGTGVIPWMPEAHPVDTVYNREAIVPPQCYTATQSFYNPCYVCHQDEMPQRENRMNDGDLQEAYSFSDLGMTNHWKNLFEDRRERAAMITDEAILAYIGEDNYRELPDRLRQAGFKGWIPDLNGLAEGPAAFDEFGFARDGSHWVAFNYKPFPSTFWPTNGSTDDVMIRLPEAYRNLAEDRYSVDVYRANLAILEAAIKGLPAIGCLPVDEAVIGRDLDGDGELGTVHQILRTDVWVGAAEGMPIDTFLYPAGTEFLHTVRYLGVDESGHIGVSRRVKEVRYMKKWRWYPKQMYARRYELESFEKEVGNLPGYTNLGDYGFDNGNGWSVQGFIEDAKGRLRANTFEENLFCMGCHNSIGATIDKTFSFARKVDGAPGWSYIDLRSMRDAPSFGEALGEYLVYMERAGGGSEFRNNEEMRERWFHADGTLDRAKVQSAPDIYSLITPSPARAFALNKAYKVIVEDQDFIFGRDAILEPPVNVHPRIDNQSAETLPPERIFPYDIRLAW